VARSDHIGDIKCNDAASRIGEQQNT
jgi:hypothetical protein